MSHLGRWLSALVDSELCGSERDLVLNHIAACERCLGEVNALRALKRRMSALGETAADSALTGRLIGLSADAASLPRWPAGFDCWPASGRAFGRGRGLPRFGWTAVGAVAGAATVVISAAAFLLGGGTAQAPLPKITPAVDTYWLQHDYHAGVLPAAKPAPAKPAPAGPAAPAAPVHVRPSARVRPSVRSESP